MRQLIVSDLKNVLNYNTKIMRNYIALFIPFVFVLFACETVDDEDQPQLVDLVLEDIRNNQDLLNLAFEKGALLVTSANVNVIKEESQSKREFIIALTELTEDLFVDAVEETQIPVAHYLKIGGVDGESTNNSVRLLSILTNVAVDPLPGYYDILMREGAEIEPPVWALIQNYRNASGTDIPIEEMTLNYGQIEASFEFSDILLSSETDQQKAEEISEVARVEDIPPLTVALLLPAVQKLQEEGEAVDPLEQWLDSILIESNNSEMINRIKAGAYLASLDQLINSRYDNSNQLSASAQIMQANFEATMMFFWAEVWDQMED